MSTKTNTVVEMKEEEAIADIAADFFDACLEQLHTRMAEKTIGPSTIMLVVRYAMEIAELTHFKGAKQRDLATGLVERAIKDTSLPEAEEKLLLAMVDEDIVGSTIDLVVGASKGELDVNAVAEVAVGCCAALLKTRRRPQE